MLSSGIFSIGFPMPNFHEKTHDYQKFFLSHKTQHCLLLTVQLGWATAYWANV